MRIMFVIHSLHFRAGAETILTHFANFFAQKGHHVSICLLTDEKVIFNLNSQIKLYPNNSSKKKSILPKQLSSTYRQINHIYSSIKVEDPDIIISYISATNILSSIATRIARKPIILAERSSYHLSLKNRYWKLLRRMVYPFATKAIVLTHEDQPKYHYVKEVLVLPNPLILKNKHHNIRKEKIILGVGRLSPVKGFDMLIKAFAKLKTDEWKLIIAGEGKEQEQLQNLINTLDVTHKVSLVGMIEDIEYYYRQASIFVLSSRSEGFPGALCEAMGYGCCPIAFNCPTGPKEIITHNIDGILVEANNINQLHKEIYQIINNDTKRVLLGKAAEKISTKLDIENLGKQWEKTLEITIKHFHQNQ